MTAEEFAAALALLIAQGRVGGLSVKMIIAGLEAAIDAIEAEMK